MKNDRWEGEDGWREGSRLDSGLIGGGRKERNVDWRVERVAGLGCLVENVKCVGGVMGWV